jgi:hypothetical protein
VHFPAFRDKLMHTAMPVIDYLHDLAAAAFTAGCGAMWMMLQCYPLSSGPETDRFFAHAARGLSFMAACSLTGFIATGIVRVFYGTRPEVIEGLVLLLPVCAGLFVWCGAGRKMRRLKRGK